MASSLFRFIAAVGRDITVALTFGSFALAILFAMSGFVLSKDNLKKWWLWGFWISPMMCGQNAMVLLNSTEPLGVEILRTRGFFTESYWYWIGVGALVGYTSLFNIGYILALTFLNPIGKHQTLTPEEPQSNEQIGGSRQETLAAETNHNRKRGMVLPFKPYSITFDEVTIFKYEAKAYYIVWTCNKYVQRHKERGE